MALLLDFQETPTKELGHCSDEAAQGSELSGTSASGPPYLGRCLNSESSTDEEGSSAPPTFIYLGLP